MILRERKNGGGKKKNMNAINQNYKSAPFALTDHSMAC